MARPRKPLGEKELALLRLVVDRQPVTVREVADHAAKSAGIARTTVLTVMERLRTKGYLRRKKVGGVYRYECTAPRAELMRNLVGDFVDRMLGGSVSPFVAYLSESERVSADELSQLRELVRSLEQREDDE